MKIEVTAAGVALVREANDPRIGKESTVTFHLRNLLNGRDERAALDGKAGTWRRFYPDRVALTGCRQGVWNGRQGPGAVTYFHERYQIENAAEEFNRAGRVFYMRAETGDRPEPKPKAIRSWAAAKEFIEAHKLPYQVHRFNMSNRGALVDVRTGQMVAGTVEAAAARLAGEGEAERETDVCITGNPARNGNCGEPDCVACGGGPGTAGSKSLYIITHDHRHGTTTYLCEAASEPTEKQVIAAFGIDFEPDREEFIGIEKYDGKPLELDGQPVYRCHGCGRPEATCSADPCEGVKRDRES